MKEELRKTYKRHRMKLARRQEGRRYLIKNGHATNAQQSTEQKKKLSPERNIQKDIRISNDQKMKIEGNNISTPKAHPRNRR